MALIAIASRARRLLCLIGFAALSGSVLAQDHTDAALAAQRAAFKQAYASASQQGGDGWRALAGNLQNYPLYPYLQAAALEHDLQQTDRASVEAYLQHYPALIPAQDLRRDFLQELARRQDWPDFQAMYQPGLGNALSCDALQAKLAQQQPLDFQRDLATLWQSPSLPSQCDPVLQAAKDQGLLTRERLWSRIDAAADASKPSSVSQMAGWLDGNDATEAGWLALALNNAGAAVVAANHWPDVPHARQAATLALVKLAHRQSDVADDAWQKLQTHLSFSPSQRDSILNALALFHATDYDPNALARLIALPPSAQSAATYDWRVRVALAEQDWNAVLAAIEAMPASQQQQDEWQYFRARALAALGRADEARAAYETAAQQSSYFGFMAADHAGVDYALCVEQPAFAQTDEQAVLAMPGMQRAFELFAVGLLKPARREWTAALADADPGLLRAAVALASQRGWNDRAIFTFNKGPALSYYTYRFPLVPEAKVPSNAQQAGIDPSWAYGILRQESAWVSDAQSGANARGLMQLVPSTAADVARRNGLPWGGGDSLYDPAINVQLGTLYLAQLADRFEGSPWLASAAYNAGAARVQQWLQLRSGLQPDLFVATMPFAETRDYVARVLYYAEIYDWRMHGSSLPVSSRMPPIGQPFSRPDGSSGHKAMSCPAPVATAAPSSSVAPAAAGSSGTIHRQ